jgi:hypothetical protein
LNQLAGLADELLKRPKEGDHIVCEKTGKGLDLLHLASEMQPRLYTGVSIGLSEALMVGTYRHKGIAEFPESCLSSDSWLFELDQRQPSFE